MQQPDWPNPRHRNRERRVLTAVGGGVVVCLSVVLASGGEDSCGDGQSTGSTDRPYAGATLAIRCPDARLAGLLTPLANVWATRTGAKVEIGAAALSPGDAADIGVMPFAE